MSAHVKTFGDRLVILLPYQTRRARRAEPTPPEMDFSRFKVQRIDCPSTCHKSPISNLSSNFLISNLQSPISPFHFRRGDSPEDRGADLPRVYHERGAVYHERSAAGPRIQCEKVSRRSVFCEIHVGIHRPWIH